MTRARVLTIAAHKGGAGKTTTALGLAAALARRAAVLLVDVDPQGHATTGLGVELPDDALTVRDVLPDGVEVARAIAGTAVAGVSALPASIRLERVTQWLYMRPRRETLLGTALRRVRSNFEWIVIDCPPSLGALTEMAIACADLVIVPCRMEARASNGLTDLLELLALVRGEGWSSWRILRTQVDARKTVTNAAVMDTLAPWTTRLLQTTVPQCEALNQAQLARVDIFTFDPSCSGATAYVALAKEITSWRRAGNNISS